MKNQNIKKYQILSKIIKTWYTACDFLTGGQALTNFYRWLSRRMYGRETRVIKTRGGDRYVLDCQKCPFSIDDGYNEILFCLDRDKSQCEIDDEIEIDPACELHFRTPVLLQILPVILAAIGIAAIFLTAYLLFFVYR